MIIRIVALVALLLLGAIAVMVATLLGRSPPEASAPAAQHAELVQRIDRLELAVSKLAQTRTAAPSISTPASASAASLEPPARPIDVPAGRAPESALRDSHAIVDRAIDAARWTAADARELAAASAALSGDERTAVYAKLTMAINQDRVKVDRDAMSF